MWYAWKISKPLSQLICKRAILRVIKGTELSIFPISHGCLIFGFAWCLFVFPFFFFPSWRDAHWKMLPLKMTMTKTCGELCLLFSIARMLCILLWKKKRYWKETDKIVRHNFSRHQNAWCLVCVYICKRRDRIWKPIVKLQRSKSR